MKLILLKDRYSVYRFDIESSISLALIKNQEFYSITETSEELSIVCKEGLLSSNKEEKNWKILKVQGPLDFGMIGVLYSISKPLAENSISIFVISTFDTDYIMIKEDKLSLALEVLEKNSFIIEK